MATQFAMVKTQTVLNRGAARGGSPIRLGPVILTLQPVAAMQWLGPSGMVGKGTKKAAEKVVRFAQGSITRAGRVQTGWMRDSIHATFAGSNQHQSRFKVASKARYAWYQHEGTDRIQGLPFLTRALARLRPADWL